jgi:hypothetical protein
MIRRWAVVRVSKEVQSQRKDARGNTILETVPGIVTFRQVTPYATNEQLVIYYSSTATVAGAGWVAQLTGTEGKEVTDRLPQERWADLYSQVQAVLALTGDIGKVPLQEIF